MKSNTWAILLLLLGALLVAANAAASLRGNALKQSQSGNQHHTLEQKNIDQDLADGTQFVEADATRNSNRIVCSLKTT